MSDDLYLSANMIRKFKSQAWTTGQISWIYRVSYREKTSLSPFPREHGVFLSCAGEVVYLVAAYLRPTVEVWRKDAVYRGGLLHRIEWVESKRFEQDFEAWMKLSVIRRLLEDVKAHLG